MSSFLRQTQLSLGQKRNSVTSTPASINSIRSKRSLIKQQKSVSQIYQDVRKKLQQMESTFKTQRTHRERQMLQTYIKILQKIGEQVIQSKQRYLNLDKQALRTDKRLQIVQELNTQRTNCNKLSLSIKNIKQQIKKYEDQNNYLQQQVQALQKIQKDKKQLERQQKFKYKQNRKHATSQQKKIQPTDYFQRSKQISTKRKSFDLSNHNSLSKKTTMKNQINTLNQNSNHRVKSFIVNDNSCEFNQVYHNNEPRPHTQQKSENYLGNKRKRNINFNFQLQENLSFQNNLQ